MACQSRPYKAKPLQATSHFQVLETSLFLITRNRAPPAPPPSVHGACGEAAGTNNVPRHKPSAALHMHVRHPHMLQQTSSHALEPQKSLRGGYHLKATILKGFGEGCV